MKVAPLALFTGQGFPAHELSGPGLLLGLGLLAAGLASERLGRKAHFAYTYLLLGSNAALLAALVRLFESDGGTATPTLLRALAVTLLILGICTGLGWYARRTQSYVFILLAVGYGYVAVTNLLGIADILWPLALLYFPLTLLGIILFFINIKQILRIA
ncbi:MAG: hypothetical protein EOO59_11845 [Hymenobacter sp.]|nr:MAG: hypothetical protein EOO59_11845 [Hymenobacter sp.]